MEVFIEIFAGLGLFFVGIKLIANNLQQLSAGWFRRLIQAATRNTFFSGLLGLLSGALTQSTAAITFISISMVTIGLIDVARVAPMVIWANVGTSLLVFFAAIDINLVVLFLLGVTGVAYYFDVDKAPRLRHVLGALLGLGILSLGLELIKHGSIPLKEMETARDFLTFAASSHPLAFIAGVVLAIVAQSSATVAIVAVTLTDAGLLSLDQTIVIVIGASLGSGLSTVLLASNLSGIGRQIAYLQGVVKFLGVVAILPFVLGETYGLFPGVKALIVAVGHDAATQVALVYLLMQIASAILGTLLQRPTMAIVARLSPPSLEETLAKPRYIYPEAAADPTTALDLVAREQMRLFEYLPSIVDAVRPDGESKLPPEALFNSASIVARQCDEFMTGILDHNNSRVVLLDVIHMQKRNEVLISLIGAVNDYVIAVKGAGQRREDDKFGRILFALGESLHTILLVANDAFASRQRADVDLLLEFTSDRSAQMEGIRRRVMEVGDLSPADHHTLYATTTLFERTLWLVRRFAVLVEGEIETPAALAAE